MKLVNLIHALVMNRFDMNPTEANQLRIGNYIKHLDYHLKVISISQYMICCEPHWGFDMIGDIEGIPLSEDILVKANCIKGHKKNYYWREHLLFELFNVTALDGGFRIIAGRLQKGIIIVISEEIKYLHQLQNIYQSLTSTELNIEL